VPTGTSPIDSGSTVTEVTPGYSPYSAVVTAIAITAAQSTAVHSSAVPGLNGLSTGIYNDTTSFVIESRDVYSNRVFSGPVNETQIIETFGFANATSISGSIGITYNGHTVEVGARAGPMQMKIALQSLPGVGFVDVNTNSVTQLVSGVTGKVIQGSVYIVITGVYSSVFTIGDWIRVGSATGPVFTITSIDTVNGIFTISSPYLLYTPLTGSAGVALYQNADRVKYQYIVTFDSVLGDLPALSIDNTLLIDNNNHQANVQVTSCDLYAQQVVYTGANSVISGTFFLMMNGVRTLDLPFNVTTATMQSQLQTLPGMYSVAVSRTGPDSKAAYAWTVTFLSYDQPPAPLYADSLLLQVVFIGVLLFTLC